VVTTLLIATFFVAMLAVYELIHNFLPSWGTVLTNVIAGATMLIDYARLLPWGTVLDAHQAALIGFAIAAANGVIRFRGEKNPVGSGQ
jgi:hypothetical protein